MTPSEPNKSLLLNAAGSLAEPPPAEQSRQAVKNRKAKEAVALKAADEKRQTEAAELREKKAAEEQVLRQRGRESFPT